MAEGEAGDTMYIICEGQVEVSRTLVMKHAEGEFRDSEKVLSRLDASRQPLFGEMALFGDFPRTATVTTLSECLFYEIGRADFLQLMESHPRLGVKVLTGMARLLSHRLKKTDEDVIRLTTALSIALSK
jgi:CRP-like cAMP-binding protein